VRSQYEGCYCSCVCVQQVQVVTVMQQAADSIVHHGTVLQLLPLLLLRDAKRAIYYVNSDISAHLKHHGCSMQSASLQSQLDELHHAGVAPPAAATAAANQHEDQRRQLTHVLASQVKSLCVRRYLLYS